MRFVNHYQYPLSIKSANFITSIYILIPKIPVNTILHV